MAHLLILNYGNHNGVISLHGIGWYVMIYVDMEKLGLLN